MPSIIYIYKIYNTNIVFIENPVLKNRKSECMTFSRTLAKKGGILGSWDRRQIKQLARPAPPLVNQ